MNKFLLLLFKAGFSSDPFPYDECTLVGREQGIKESDSKYWVAVQDKQGTACVEVHICTPYSFEDETRKVGGWQCVGSSRFFRMPAEDWSECEDDVPICFMKEGQL